MSEIKDLKKLAEEAGWTDEEFHLEVLVVFAAMAEKILSSDPKLKSLDHQFNLGDRILNIKSTLETIQ